MRKIVIVVIMVIAMAVQAQERFVFMPQWTAQAQFAGYYVALEKGFYKAEGINVDIVHPSATQTTLSRVKNEGIQATTLQLSQAMKLVDSGIPLVNILQTSMNNALTIVSRRGKNPLTQKGERVAIWSADFGDMALCMSAQEHLDYEWVKYAANMNLFIKGAVDAAVAMSYNEFYQLVQTGLPITETSVYRFSDHEYNVQDEGTGREIRQSQSKGLGVGGGSSRRNTGNRDGIRAQEPYCHKPYAAEADADRGAAFAGRP